MENSKLKFTRYFSVDFNPSVKTILETAIRECKAGAFDSVWCVFDGDAIGRDGINDNLKSLFNEAKNLGMHFADSFPAFEIWFLLHYEMPKHFYENQSEAIKGLQKHIIGYSITKKWLSCASLYSKLKPQLKIAIANSERLAEANAKRDSKDSTRCNVHKLFCEIRKIN